MGFADNMRKSCDNIVQAMSDSTAKVAEDLFKTNVYLSPTPSGKGGYSVGTIKNNWYSSVGAPDSSFSGSVDASGVNSLSRIDSTISSKPFFGKDNIVYLTNSTKWAVRADSIGWPSGDPTNDTGWIWSGRIGPYLFTSTSMQQILNKYS